MDNPTVLDCDPGIDDAVAILVALAEPALDLVGITTVGGNVGLAHTTRNALGVLALAGRDDIPVAAGADRPLIGSPERAELVHGVDGIGGVPLPDPGRGPVEAHAVEFLASVVRGSAAPVTLIATGPLTNVALFYAVYPELAARLGRLVWMGGGVHGGNRTPAAEFNAWYDPEAAYRVLTDPGLPRAVPTTEITLDVTLPTALDQGHLSRMRSSGPVGAAMVEALGMYLASYRKLLGREAVPVHDAVAVLAAARPELVRTQRAHVEVDTGHGPHRGATLVDLHRITAHPPTVDVSLGADVPAVIEGILSAFGA
jgi:pyrimidine-specific ribonucleoside hydrolase